MENFDEICDLENFFQQSKTFKNNKPFKYAFIEGFFKHDFYEKLFETYPEYEKDDSDWSISTKFSKHIFLSWMGKIQSISLCRTRFGSKIKSRME